MADGQKSNPDFNTASGCTGEGVRTMALMIDLQQGCLQYMGRNEVAAYLDHMATVLDDLRGQKNTQVGWVTIGDVENDLHKPETGNHAKRDAAELGDLGFFDSDKNKDLFETFMDKHGPRKDEPVFRKTGFSALGDDEPALKAYLAEQKTGKVLLSGGMATYCVGATAQDAVASGYDTAVATDTVIGWKGGTRPADYAEGATWSGEDHGAKIRSMYDGVKDRISFDSHDGLSRATEQSAPQQAISRLGFDRA